MFRLCLFDLDNTLVSTDDLQELRESSRNPDVEHLQAIVDLLDSNSNRIIYPQELLTQIKAEFPQLKLGVFTRSPRRYAQTILSWAYPEFEWDILIAYEDVKRTKPFRDGIYSAMDQLGVENIIQVILVGDNDVDVRSAYHAGCVAVLDTSTWKYPKVSGQWHALDHMPDAIIEVPEDLLEVLDTYPQFLPELERLLDHGKHPTSDRYRFDELGHFIPEAIGGDKKPHMIYSCGRSFSQYESLRSRRDWHSLTKSIGDYKDAEAFPKEWVIAVRHFIEYKYSQIAQIIEIKVLLTVVPHRPGRAARLEAFLGQLQQYFDENPIDNVGIKISPDLLGYKDGVKSQHHDLLGRVERFVNVRDHLYVRTPKSIDSNVRYIVIDDVVTTGASLIYASKYLKAKGAKYVTSLALAKNVSDVLPRKQ